MVGKSAPACLSKLAALKNPFPDVPRSPRPRSQTVSTVRLSSLPAHSSAVGRSSRAKWSRRKNVRMSAEQSNSPHPRTAPKSSAKSPNYRTTQPKHTKKKLRRSRKRKKGGGFLRLRRKEKEKPTTANS